MKGGKGQGETPPPVVGSVLRGETGWIYIGTRVDDQWQSSAADGSEPAVTIEISGTPQRGSTYRLIRGVNLREELPKQLVPGNRPLMPKSKGAIEVGTKVKVDEVVEIEITNPSRTWIWGHVTVL